MNPKLDTVARVIGAAFWTVLAVGSLYLAYAVIGGLA